LMQEGNNIAISTFESTSQILLRASSTEVFD
jgi:hypothetical protein